MRKPQTVARGWPFTIVIDREPSDAEMDARYEAGLDDATIEVGPGARLVHLERRAPSLLEAIASAVRDLHSVGGPRPIGIDLEESRGVTLSDVLTRLGGARTPESQRLLAAGQRDREAFLGPFSTPGTSGSTPGSRPPPGCTTSWATPCPR